MENSVSPKPSYLPIAPVENPTPPPAVAIPEHPVTPETPLNPATVATEAFKKEQQHGFLRSLGHVIRTATGEFFTWFGGPMIPAGIALAAKAMTDPESLKNIAKGVLQDPTFKERIAKSVGPDMVASSIEKLQPYVEAMPLIGTGVGIAASAIGLLLTRVGTGIGWNSAKHGNEKIQTLYQLGKMAELGTATLAIFNPALAFLYPVAKGFSIAATFIAHTKRP